ISAVATDSAAAAAGIQSDDVVLAVEGVEVGDDGDLGAIIREFAPGTTVDILLDRDGAELTVAAELGENTDITSPYTGTALLGVSSYGVREWHEMGLGEAMRTSITDLGPS